MNRYFDNLRWLWTLAKAKERNDAFVDISVQTNALSFLLPFEIIKICFRVREVLKHAQIKR